MAPDDGIELVGGGTSHGSENDDDHILQEFLYRRCVQFNWLPTQPDAGLGLVLRRPDGSFVAKPHDAANSLIPVIHRLDAAVVLTISSEVTRTIMRRIIYTQRVLWLQSRGMALPIVQSVNEEIELKRQSFACLSRAENYLLIWDDDVQRLLMRGRDMEDALTECLQRSRGDEMKEPTALHSNAANFVKKRHQKVSTVEHQIELELLQDRWDTYDMEEVLSGPEHRPFRLTHASIMSFAMILVIVVQATCISKLIYEVRLGGGLWRLAWLCVVPFSTVLSLFFMITIAGSLCQIFAPLNDSKANSVYFSGNSPEVSDKTKVELPHVTIQMPVYKESLSAVIHPTVKSALTAIKRYEEEGGTASMYINDDGLQYLTPKEQQARKAFYELHNVGWCARPGQGRNGFVRQGKFKKASNMNYCLDFSLRVEACMDDIIQEICDSNETSSPSNSWTAEDGMKAYETAFAKTLEDDEGRTWAGGEVRIGEIILLIDSDSRVPENCLLDAALELRRNPDVAVLQHSSSVMQVTQHTFENGISYFTDLIYWAAQFAVCNGDCSPFVGHNAFIRWPALQHIGWQEDGVVKFWSEAHVSEDFDAMLRLSLNGFTIRLAAYHRDGFKEGVSLTVFDEIMRWEKYTYGCAELTFRPLHQWPHKGPFSSMLPKFIFSSMKITSKISILAYIGNYFAIASAFPLAIVNYFVTGWYDVDAFYITSWNTWIGIVIVFNGLAPLGLAMAKHRQGETTFFRALAEAIKWTPLLLVFFSGLSWHLFNTYVRFFLGINMSWGFTAKERFSRWGLYRALKNFKFMYLILFGLCSGMVYLGIYASKGYRISTPTAIVPLAVQLIGHALVPFVFDLF